jgi:tetratricopeptide (TPR) repeat protein
MLKLLFRIPAILLLFAATVACEPRPDPFGAELSPYQQAVAAFYTGTAAFQVGEGSLAENRFHLVAELFPDEPAAWANLGLVSLQRGELQRAADHLALARSLPPENSRIELLSGLVAHAGGSTAQAVDHLRRSIELDPSNLRSAYLLAQLAAQEEGPVGMGEAEDWIDRILEVEPGNLAALLERARLAARARDAATLDRTIERIQARADVLPAGIGPRLTELRAADGAFDRAADRITLLEAELQRYPVYRDDQAALQISPTRTELLLTRFLHLENPAAQQAPADTAITFSAEPLSTVPGEWAWVRSLWLSDEMPSAVLVANQSSVWIRGDQDRAETLEFPGRASAGPLPIAAVAAIDYDYDFRMDLVLAGEGGLRLLRQERDGSFSDVTAGAVPAATARGAYTGAWAADLDMDGDMDLVLAPVDGPPLVLLNRGDGGFEPTRVFPGVQRLRAFAWADLDTDGTPDAILLDADGGLHVFLNQRLQEPQFRAIPPPAELGAVHAIAVADLSQDAILDLLVLGADGTLSRLSLLEGEWQREEVAQWPNFTAGEIGSARLFLADLDNNGGLDVVASIPHGAQLWLNTEDGLRPHHTVDAWLTDVADLRDEGRLDLLGMSPAGEPVWFANRGTLDYFALSLRPRAAGTTGDRRINSFGIGGEIEIRAGLLYQKQLIHTPTTRFGLGEQSEVNVARIIWPHGGAQAEFNLPATNETMLAQQRLHGSCPWVFTYDGERMQFITDFLWRTALGLRINAQGGTAVIHSEDWIRIRGDQLAPRDGYYDVRITADLWETHFFDHVALMAVDHPADVEVHVDERFTLPAPEPGLVATSSLRPVAAARDHRGQDVTALVAALDDRYLDTFELGAYQGVAEEHYVEIDLGGDAPAGEPLWLVATGWVYPTDSSINLAIGQGDNIGPRPLQLEVADGRGGWKVVKPDLGFPAGKMKTMLIDLQGAFQPGAPRRLRLRTNMEIYWDRIAWAVGRPDVPLREHRLLPRTAELRYRGFSAVSQASRRAPELPDYGTIATTAPLWRDLEGFHTRFGDVLPLVEAVDDRYVIMNAGDELHFRFPEVPAPPPGWTRTFVLIGDGWVKDGNFNTGFSRTVLPLPYHGLADYDRPPGRLEDDPAHRLHPNDWKEFHTRYVTPRDFHHALVPRRGE